MESSRTAATFSPGSVSAGSPACRASPRVLDQVQRKVREQDDDDEEEVKVEEAVMMREDRPSLSLRRGDDAQKRHSRRGEETLEARVHTFIAGSSALHR